MRLRLTHISLSTVLLFLLGTGLFLVFYGSALEELPPTPALVLEAGELPTVTATSALVVEIDSGLSVYEKAADVQRPIASITKLVSSAMFYEYMSPTTTVTVDWSDLATHGRSGRLAYGDVYTGAEPLFPLLLESSNDAASTMNRAAPVDLVRSMNTYAQDQQLHQTRFTDASGLSEENLSTARELSTLGLRLYEEYPHVFDITRLKHYLNDVGAWLNNSPFVAEPGYVGGKHGYTYEAGRTAITFFDEALPSGVQKRFAYVLLGSDDLAADMQELRRYVQQNVDYK